MSNTRTDSSSPTPAARNVRNTSAAGTSSGSTNARSIADAGYRETGRAATATRAAPSNASTSSSPATTGPGNEGRLSTAGLISPTEPISVPSTTIVADRTGWKPGEAAAT